MAKERKKSITPSTKRASDVVTTDDGVTTDDVVTTRDDVVMDESVSTNGGVIVDALDEDQRDMHGERAVEVAKLAYSKYEARGFVDGHDVEDWLAAEAEL